MAETRVIYRVPHAAASLAYLRGGGLRNADVKAFVKERGFRWSGRDYAYHAPDDLTDGGLVDVLRVLHQRFGCALYHYLSPLNAPGHTPDPRFCDDKCTHEPYVREPLKVIVPYGIGAAARWSR